MTPKEKAIYLYIMYKQRTSYREVFHTQELLDKFHDNAKSCALIAVDEILKLDNPNTYNYLTENKEHLIVELANKYWQEVKKEIEAL
jgi:hypothetical protein